MLQRHRRPGAPRALRARPGDRGFTVIELLLSMVIIAIVISALLTVFVGSLTTTVQAKQRQAASALATQNLERVRALPYDVLVAGNRVADLAGDPAVVTSGVPRVTFEGVTENLVTSTTQNVAPLFPHRRTVVQDDVTYTVGVYVTRGTTTNTSYNLTSAVTWQAAGGGPTRQIVQRSVAYSADGCLSTANRPFSGPCQAAFSANAGITAGQVRVTNPTDSTLPITGTDGLSLGLDLPGLSATTAVEQTVTVSSTARSFGATALTTTGETNSGGVQASSGADTDPSSADNTSATSTTPSQTTSPVSVSGFAGTFRATPSTGDTGRVSSEITATGPGCEWVGGVGIGSGRPCASGRVASPGVATIVHELPNFLGSSVDVPLSSVTAGSTASRAAAGRLTTSTNGLCPTTSADGCAVASASRSLSTVSVGGLPVRTRSADVVPAAFEAVGSTVRVTGLTETALAASGRGANPPAYTRAGSLSYWNGTAFTTVDLAGITTDQVYDSPPVTGTFTNGIRTWVITADATVRVVARSTSQVNPLPCGDVTGPCSASATAPSVVSAQVEYTLVERVVGFTDVERTRYVVVADLGAVTASSYYQAAPDA